MGKSSELYIELMQQLQQQERKKEKKQLIKNKIQENETVTLSH